MRGRHRSFKAYFEVQRGGWYHHLSELADDHCPEQLLGHFVVGPEASVAPASWPRRELSGLILRHEPSLPAFDVVDSAGAPVGWLLGHPIDVADRTVAAGPFRVPAAAEAREFKRRFEDWLYAYGGRFAAIVVSPFGRAYNDPFGSLPILFDPGKRRLASSPFLLVDPGETVPDSALVEVIDPYGTNRYFPFAETGHRDASRLLPSHELDLGTFEQRRVWPPGPLPPLSPDEAVERIGSIVEATIEAVAKGGDAVMGMTAGGDSRMMLACSRNVPDGISLFTIPHDDIVGRNDAATAALIAREIGLDHRILPWIDGTEEDVRLWFYRTGALAGETRGRDGVRTYDQLARNGKCSLISGVGVEIGRGYAWNRSLGRSEEPDTPAKRLTGEQLAARISAPGDPAIADAAARWLRGVPGLDALDTIDLCCLEATHGGWSGPITLGNPHTFTTTIYPFGHRTILEAVLGLPYEYRSGDRLRRDLIARRWPELGRYPINRLPRPAKLTAKAQRIAQMPGGAVRRVRRRRLQP